LRLPLVSKRLSMAIPCSRLLVALSIAFVAIQYPSFASAQWACGATYATGLTPASPAVCPAGQPIGCGTVSEPDYCCPAGTYCKIDSNNNVGCCLYADSCYGEIVGNNGQYPTSYYQSTYYPSTTYVQPSTVYVTQPQAGTTVYAPVVAATQPVVTTYAPVVAVTQPVVTTYGPSTLQTQAAYAGYCSTLRENGPNLPTTGAGSCGTILIVAGAGRLDMDMIPWAALFMVVQLIMIQ